MFLYELTNLQFRGVERSATPDGFVADTVLFNCNDFKCVLRHVDNYDQIIKEISSRNGSAITATLEIDSLNNLVMDESGTDDFADAVCELLSLATKNTVYWVGRTRFDAGGRVASSTTRNHIAQRARPLLQGWRLIPDFVALPEKVFRAELSYFLGTVAPAYVNALRSQGLSLAIAWILDSEHQSTVDMMYVAAFIAIERLRVSFLKRNTLPTFIHENWIQLLDRGLAHEIIVTIESRVGTLTDTQKELLSKKLRSLNDPPAAVELEALCNQLGVTGFEKDMSNLRNNLFTLGDSAVLIFQKRPSYTISCRTSLTYVC
jgi:hypothetical protein